MNVTKTFVMKYLELVNALRLLHDSCELYKSGKKYHLLSIGGQLRALLYNGKISKGLLFEIASDLNVPLQLYCNSVGDFPEYLPKPDYYIKDNPISFKPNHANQALENLDAILLTNIVMVKGEKLTTLDIIKKYADKLGGAHYDPIIPEVLKELVEISFNGDSGIYQLILQLGEAIKDLGIDIIKKHIDFHYDAVINVPELPEDEIFLIDCVNKLQDMRFSIKLDSNGVLFFVIKGLGQDEFTIECPKEFVLNSPAHLSFRTFTTNNFDTQIQVSLNDAEYDVAGISGPLLLLPNWDEYDVYFNRGVEDGPQDFEFGVLQVVSSQASYEELKKLNLFSQNHTNTNQPNIIFFHKGSFGFSPSGTKNITMTGEVKHIS